jgi:transcriptional regulator with XRE-family HTH domain
VNRLREARLARDLTQHALAQKAGLSVGTIHRIERGEGSRVGTKVKILHALGLERMDRATIWPDGAGS